MKKLYIILVLLASIAGGARAQKDYGIIVNLNSIGISMEYDLWGNEIPPVRYLDADFTSIVTIPYTGVAPGFDEVSIIEEFNSQFYPVYGDEIQCLKVSGVDTANPESSKGLIYLRFEPFEADPGYYNVNARTFIIFSILNNIHCGLGHFGTGWGVMTSSYIYGLDYSSSDGNIQFHISGPSLLSGKLFSLRKVIPGRPAYEWPVVATIDPGLTFSGSPIPSATISVPMASIESGSYILVGRYPNELELESMVHSNPVTIDIEDIEPPLILESYPLSGGGEIAVGSSGSVTLGGRQSGVTYQLYLNNTLLANTLPTNGNSFTGLTQYGKYRVKATYQSQEAWMTGEVGIWPKITRSTVAGGGAVNNNEPVTITLPTSQTILTYKLLKNGTAVQQKQGTGGALSFSVTEPGTYTITAGLQDYFVQMTGSATVTTGINHNNGGDNNASYSSSHNYVAEKVYVGLMGTNTISNVTYTDGFGRPLQEIAVNASPAGGDIVTPHVYGKFGRKEREYLPFNRSANTGAYHTTPTTPSNWSAYGATDQPYAFTTTAYDDSPLDQITRQTGPGQAWHTAQKGIATAYALNTANEVRLYRVTDAGALTNDGYYAAGRLQKITSTDEDGCTVITYTDNQERVLLSVAIEGQNRLETYNVYDDRGLLRWVLSPEASARLGASINTTTLDEYAYRYDYDPRGRMIQKKLPGSNPVYMVYDARDRLVMSQDGKQRAESASKWSYSLYDSRNRVIETGEVAVTGTATHAALQSAASGSQHYTPSGTRTPLQYTLYDTYTPSANVPVHAFVPGYAASHHTLVVGLTTSVKTRVLNVTPEKWLTTTTYYDDKCRVIQTVSDNVQGYISRLDMQYDFTDNVVKQRETHKVSATRTDVMETTNTYDYRGRLLSSSTILNGGAPAVTLYGYDALGRLSTRMVGTVTETTTYNVRSWLTAKAAKKGTTNVFSMNLRYHDALSAADRWNGNISEWQWQHETATAQTYRFAYDGVNRLTEALSTGNYNEKGITYDRNGNILSLQRTAGSTTLVDDLVYGYIGNQLRALDEGVRTVRTGDIYAPGSTATGTYSYDANGNMITDARKSLNFTYNFLNLLSEVKSGSTVKAKYTWLADGSKLQVRNNITTGFDYLGSLTYTSNSSGLTLETAQFSGGVIRSGNSQEINYFLTDHLGSVRSIVNASGTAVERNDYYAFGAKHVYGNYPKTDNRLKFNAKEEQTTGALGYLDYGARPYDPTLGRWFNVDPLAENYFAYSPFHYALNNPVFFIDPNGEDVYMYFYVNGHSKPQDDAMFWASALTWALGMLNSGAIGDGDVYTIRGISDLGLLGNAVSDVIDEFSPRFGKTAEFGLWSHGALDGPIGSKNTTGQYALGISQMTLAGWGAIDFNWKNNGANAYFFGCRTAWGDSPWAEKMSGNANMRDVNVWGQSSWSFPSLIPDGIYTDKNIMKGNHSIPRYMVGGNGRNQLWDSISRKLKIPGLYESFKMKRFINGEFYDMKYQQ